MWLSVQVQAVRCSGSLQNSPFEHEAGVVLHQVSGEAAEWTQRVQRDFIRIKDCKLEKYKIKLLCFLPQTTSKQSHLDWSCLFLKFVLVWCILNLFVILFIRFYFDTLSPRTSCVNKSLIIMTQLNPAGAVQIKVLLKFVVLDRTLTAEAGMRRHQHTWVSL